MTPDGRAIPADFPCTSHHAEVHGARMHYVDEGEGPVVLLLHGNPTWSYLWRNIIPWLSPHARCVAPDLVGMGRSDKPDIDYRFLDHARYLDGFIDSLGLEDVTLVGHDWGAALGLHWARRHPGRVRAIALLEAILAPARWSEFPAEFRVGFRLMRAPVIGWCLVSGLNGFVERVLPAAVVRRLSKEEMDQYRMPFPDLRSRRPVRRWPCEIPIDGRPADVHAAVVACNRYLQQTGIPKLLLYAQPGGIIRAPMVAWCRDHLRTWKRSTSAPASTSCRKTSRGPSGGRCGTGTGGCPEAPASAAGAERSAGRSRFEYAEPRDCQPTQPGGSPHETQRVRRLAG